MNHINLTINNISQLYIDKPQFKNYKNKILNFIEFKVGINFNNIISITYIGQNNHINLIDNSTLPLYCFHIIYNNDTIQNIPVSDLYTFFG